MSRSRGNRKSRRRQFEVSHQKNWLVGRYAVRETLRANFWPIEELYIDVELPSSDEAIQLAEQRGITPTRVDSARLTELCHAEHHQGVAAKMGPFPYRDESWLIDTARIAVENQSFPLIVICDRIQDTFNFGAILRTCDAVSALAVVIGNRQQAGVSPQVSRSSAGAVNHVPVVAVDDLGELIQRLTEIQIKIVAASEKADSDYWHEDLNGAVGLVIGNEATGVSDNILALVHSGLRIPMEGKVGSLNAAVAGSVLLYEIRRQQQAGS